MLVVRVGAGEAVPSPSQLFQEGFVPVGKKCRLLKDNTSA